jgi:hypothetical protein
MRSGSIFHGNKPDINPEVFGLFDPNIPITVIGGYLVCISKK